MTNDPPFDLASIDTWSGLRPGMSRAQVLEALKERDLDASEYGTDSLTVTSDEWEMDLDFVTDGTDRLWQLAVSGEAVLWNGQKLQDAKLDDIMRILGSPASAVWQSVNDDPVPTGSDSTLPSLPTDEELLEDGTFWIPERGLGIAVFQGEFMDAAWRTTQDLPGRFAGPVTDAQRQLSKQADLETRIQEKRDERFKTEPKKRDPLAPVRTLVKIAAVAAIAFVAKLGFDDMQVWNHAPTLQAKFVAVEQLPMKQFRDFLPPALRWVFPHTKDVIVEHYRVEFTPPEKISRARRSSSAANSTFLPRIQAMRSPSPTPRAIHRERWVCPAPAIPHSSNTFRGSSRSARSG